MSSTRYEPIVQKSDISKVGMENQYVARTHQPPMEPLDLAKVIDRGIWMNSVDNARVPSQILTLKHNEGTVFQQDDKNGDFTYKVEYFSKNFDNLLKEYMDDFFTEESNVYESGEPVVYMCRNSLDMAIIDYDKFVFACMTMHQGEITMELVK